MEIVKIPGVFGKLETFNGNLKKPEQLVYNTYLTTFITDWIMMTLQISHIKYEQKNDIQTNPRFQI